MGRALQCAGLPAWPGHALSAETAGPAAVWVTGVGLPHSLSLESGFGLPPLVPGVLASDPEGFELVGTVTIAASYGAGGSAIAPAVADRLGLALLDRAIPPAVATEPAWPPLAALPDD